MARSAGSGLCSTILAFALVLDCQSAFANSVDPFEGRLFLFRTFGHDVPNERGFRALCGGDDIWFKQATEQEMQVSETDTILFTDKITDMVKLAEETGPLCFTISGDYISCELAEAMAGKVHSGWKACRFITFNNTQTLVQPIDSSGRSMLEDVGNIVSDHINRHVVTYFISSLIVASSGVAAILFACFNTYRVNRKINQAKTDPHV